MNNAVLLVSYSWGSRVDCRHVLSQVSNGVRQEWSLRQVVRQGRKWEVLNGKRGAQVSKCTHSQSGSIGLVGQGCRGSDGEETGPFQAYGARICLDSQNGASVRVGKYILVTGALGLSPPSCPTDPYAKGEWISGARLRNRLGRYHQRQGRCGQGLQSKIVYKTWLDGGLNPGLGSLNVTCSTTELSNRSCTVGRDQCHQELALGLFVDVQLTVTIWPSEYPTLLVILHTSKSVQGARGVASARDKSSWLGRAIL